jgi:hypothetical protein
MSPLFFTSRHRVVDVTHPLVLRVRHDSRLEDRRL